MAPGIFQRIMENVLKGIPKVIVYLDDTLISGADEFEHLQLLTQVLSRLDCTLRRENVNFLYYLALTLVIRLMPMAYTHFLRKLKQFKMHQVLTTFMN